VAKGTLSLKRKPATPAEAAPAPLAPEKVPLYDPNKCSELRGGVGLVQEQYVFNPSGGHGYVRTLPKEQGYFLTPEQQVNYARQMAKQKQAVSPISRAAPPPAMPEKMIQMARENAQALAAENFSE
jgi:hypothetical protein